MDRQAFHDWHSDLDDPEVAQRKPTGQHP